MDQASPSDESGEKVNISNDYWIVTPTYNERDNIEALVKEIIEVVKGVSVVIVDDNSPDGTGVIADAMSKDCNNIHVIHREGKLGIGSALFAGFRYAIDNGAKYVIEMDADFSHQPAYLPKFIKESHKYDLVIGSRFVPGGKIDNRSLFRNIVSRLGNSFIRTMLRLRPKDCTSGYRCFSAQLLRSIDMETIASSNYGNLTETLYRATKRGFKVGEIPIVFPDRKFGKSKVTKQQFFDVMGTILRIKFRKNTAT